VDAGDESVASPGGQGVRINWRGGEPRARAAADRLGESAPLIAAPSCARAVNSSRARALRALL